MPNSVEAIQRLMLATFENSVDWVKLHSLMITICGIEEPEEGKFRLVCEGIVRKPAATDSDFFTEEGR